MSDPAILPSSPSAVRHPARLDAASTLLLICDVQLGIAEEIATFAGVVSVARKMTEAARLLSIPYILSEHVMLGDIIPEIDPTNAQMIIRKRQLSMMVPALEEQLRKGDVQTVLICGVEAHVAVLQTVLDLREQAFHVYVLADGISSANAPETTVALDLMRQAGAIVTSSQCVLFQLVGHDRHPLYEHMRVLQRKWRAADLANPLLCAETRVGLPRAMLAHQRHTAKTKRVKKAVASTLRSQEQSVGLPSNTGSGTVY